MRFNNTTELKDFSLVFPDRKWRGKNRNSVKFLYICALLNSPGNVVAAMDFKSYAKLKFTSLIPFQYSLMYKNIYPKGFSKSSCPFVESTQIP